MKKYVLIALLLIFMLSNGFAQETVSIRGQIANPAGSKAMVYYVSNSISGERVSHSGELDDEGMFQIEFSLEEAREFTFRHGREIAKMFLYPGDQLKIKLDAAQFDESLAYEGEGHGVASCNFLSMYFLKYEDGEGAAKKQSMLKEAEASDFQTYLNGLKAEQEKDLALANGKTNLPEVFQTYVRDMIQYDWALNMLNYPLYHAYYNQKSVEELEIPDAYYSILDEVPLKTETALDMPAYQRYVSSWVRRKYDKSLGGTESKDMDRYNLGLIDFAAGELEGKALANFTADLIRGSLKYGNPLVIEEKYHEFIQDPAHADLAEALKPAFDMAMKLAPGKMAPDFSLKNLEGEEVSLSDFRGKVVYLDFWASWCGPCRREMPSARELKARFKEKEVVFLYVSIDENEAAWRKAAEEEEMHGRPILWTKGGSSEVPVSYAIEGIPNYFLINRDGTIAHSNPARPSDSPLVDQQIQEALDRNIESSSQAGKE